MPKFGKKSLDQLRTCDPRLIEIMMELIKVMDVSVTEGHRNQVDQDAAFAKGNSKLKYPKGNHNAIPSKAVDVCPFPIDYNDRERFVLMAGIVLGIAAMKGIKLRWGGNWKGDFDLKGNTFNDLPHFEIKE